MYKQDNTDSRAAELVPWDAQIAIFEPQNEILDLLITFMKEERKTIEKDSDFCALICFDILSTTGWKSDSKMYVQVRLLSLTLLVACVFARDIVVDRNDERIQRYLKHYRRTSASSASNTAGDKTPIVIPYRGRFTGGAYSYSQSNHRTRYATTVSDNDQYAQQQYEAHQRRERERLERERQQRHRMQQEDAQRQAQQEKLDRDREARRREQRRLESQRTVDQERAERERRQEESQRAYEQQRLERERAARIERQRQIEIERKQREQQMQREKEDEQRRKQQEEYERAIREQQAEYERQERERARQQDEERRRVEEEQQRRAREEEERRRQQLEEERRRQSQAARTVAQGQLQNPGDLNYIRATLRSELEAIVREMRNQYEDSISGRDMLAAISRQLEVSLSLCYAPQMLTSWTDISHAT